MRVIVLEIVFVGEEIRIKFVALGTRGRRDAAAVRLTQRFGMIDTPMLPIVMTGIETGIGVSQRRRRDIPVLGFEIVRIVELLMLLIRGLMEALPRLLLRQKEA
jgi:galactitol-specific phosphotransferase system IIC component